MVPCGARAASVFDAARAHAAARRSRVRRRAPSLRWLLVDSPPPSPAPLTHSPSRRYDRHLSTLDRFHGADADDPASYSHNRKFSTPADSSKCSSDAAWWDAVADADECDFPLKECAGHYKTPARLCVGDIR